MVKLKISNGGYRDLSAGRRATVAAVNDNVSTSRKDAAGRVHMYEPRVSLLRAFMKASRRRVVKVVSDECADELDVVVLGIGDVNCAGTAFYVHLEPLRSARGKEVSA